LEVSNKLHDGAVIIRDLRIAKAGVFFPMPASRVMDSSFGSRHRAALGITEETDAVVVVVGEERGTISFCFNGNIVTNLDGPKLRAALDGVFAMKSPPVKKRKKKSASTQRRSVPRLSVPPSEPGEDRPSVHIINTSSGEAPLSSEDPAPQPLRKKADGDTAKASGTTTSSATTGSVTAGSATTTPTPTTERSSGELGATQPASEEKGEA
jgi:hypothetical protein